MLGQSFSILFIAAARGHENRRTLGTLDGVGLNPALVLSRSIPSP